MEFSFLRAMRASIRFTLASLKRDAKRLQRAAAEVFGQSYSLAQCQEALARARGFRTWHEAETVLKRGGRDRSLPSWTILSRNDAHEAALAALVGSELEMNEVGSVVFLGAPDEAAAPALCLWAETMSAMEKSGLILLNTKARSFQDTALGRAAADLGLDDVVGEFRFLDAREMNLGVSLSTSGRDWARSLVHALPEVHRVALQESGTQTLLEGILEALGAKRAKEEGSEYRVSAREVRTAVACMAASYPIIPRELYAGESSEELGSIEHDFEEFKKSRPKPALEALSDLAFQVEKRGLHVGRVFSMESQHRPTVLLFDEDDAVSLAVASVVHSLYFWRYVGHELRWKGIYTRPVLYYLDAQIPASVPAFVAHGWGTFSCIVPGGSLSQRDHIPEHFLSSAQMVGVEEGSLVVSGRRTPLGLTKPEPTAA